MKGRIHAVLRIYVNWLFDKIAQFDIESPSWFLQAEVVKCKGIKYIAGFQRDIVPAFLHGISSRGIVNHLHGNPVLGRL